MRLATPLSTFPEQGSRLPLRPPLASNETREEGSLSSRPAEGVTICRVVYARAAR